MKITAKAIFVLGLTYLSFYFIFNITAIYFQRKEHPRNRCCTISQGAQEYRICYNRFTPEISISGPAPPGTFPKGTEGWDTIGYHNRSVFYDILHSKIQKYIFPLWLSVIFFCFISLLKHIFQHRYQKIINHHFLIMYVVISTILISALLYFSLKITIMAITMNSLVKYYFFDVLIIHYSVLLLLLCIEIIFLLGSLFTKRFKKGNIQKYNLSIFMFLLLFYCLLIFNFIFWLPPLGILIYSFFILLFSLTIIINKLFTKNRNKVAYSPNFARPEFPSL